jgi:hypothetical protein
LTTVADRAHATDYAAMDAAAARLRDTYPNSFLVLDAIGARIRSLRGGSFSEGLIALQLQADAILDLMDAGRDLPEDVADVLADAYDPGPMFSVPTLEVE